VNEIEERFYIKRPDLKDKLLSQQVNMVTDLIDIAIKNQALPCGRGFGKTMLSGYAALYFADEYAKKIGKAVSVLLISAQRQIYDRIDEFFKYDKELRPRLRIQPSATSGYEIPRQMFEFQDTGSKVYNCKPTIGQIEGIRADVIIFDEAQDIEERIYLKARGCLKVDIIGKVIIVGTPYSDKGRGSNWFIDIVSGKDKRIKWKFSQYSSDICLWNDVKTWKKLWSSARYKAECLGFAPKPKELSFFPESHSQYNIIPTDPIRIGGGITSAGKAKSTLEVGIDFGVECTVYTLIERVGIVCNILFVKGWKGRGLETIAPEIAQLLEQHNPTLIKADSRPVDCQGIIEKYTRRKINYINTSLEEKDEEGKLMSVRQNMYGQLQRKWNKHYLIISERFVDTIVQVKRFRMGMKRGDDYVDSLALACYEPSVPLDRIVQGRVYFPVKNMKTGGIGSFKPKGKRGIIK
jgi:hypothetical protein